MVFDTEILNLTNHDLVIGVGEENTEIGSLLRIFSGLVIMPKIESCRRWRRASSGKLPPRKYTTERGVQGMSLWKFLIIIK